MKILYISIHALREEGDSRRCRCCRSRPISIHALREEGDVTSNGKPVARPISIPALREEGDSRASGSCARASNFYPRPPRGGRPGRHAEGHQPHRISIHALREEGDAIPPQATGGILIFLSTPSARRATRPCAAPDLALQFLSTPSARRATDGVLVGRGRRAISIHALREEGDRASIDNIT